MSWIWRFESAGPVGAVGAGVGVDVGFGVFDGRGVGLAPMALGSTVAGTPLAIALGPTLGGSRVVGSASVGFGVQSSTGSESGAALSCSELARAQPVSVAAWPM